MVPGPVCAFGSGECLANSVCFHTVLQDTVGAAKKGFLRKWS